MLHCKQAPATSCVEEFTRYVRGAVTRDLRLRGPLPHAERADAEQQTHVELAALLGPGYQRLVTQEANRLSGEEREAIRKAVNRAIGRARWKQTKRKQRGQPVEVSLSQLTQAGKSSAGLPGQGAVTGTTGLVDLTLDLAVVTSTFSDLERRVWQGLRAGKSTRRLGAELEIRHQRIANVRENVLRRIALSVESAVGLASCAPPEDHDPFARALGTALDGLGPIGERVWRGQLEGRTTAEMAAEFRMPLERIEQCRARLTAATGATDAA